MSLAHELSLPPAVDEHSRGAILIIDDEPARSAGLHRSLLDAGYPVFTARHCDAAVEVLHHNSVHLVMIAAATLANADEAMLDTVSNSLGECIAPVLALVPHGDDDAMRLCARAGVDDYLGMPCSAESLRMRLDAMAMLRELRLSYRCSIDEQVVGRRILSSALSARTLEIEAVKTLSRSAAVFSGDLTLMARQPGGNLHVLLADFTGHGLSAAIGVLPVADTFCVMTEKGFEPDVIIKQLNNKLHSLLPTGMFMAAAVLQLDSELASACVWNAGMPEVYVIDYDSGRIRQAVSSASMPLGISKHMDFDKTRVAIAPGDQIVMHSDGLTDSISPQGEMFGTGRFEKLLNRAGEVESLFDLVVAELDAFCAGQALADDISLVCVPCISDVVQPLIEDDFLTENISHDYNGSWRWVMELSGASLHDVDPVALVMQEYNRLTVQPVPIKNLHNVLAELYKNALEYGVFRTVRKQLERAHRCNRDDITNANLLDGSYIRVEIQQIRYQNLPAILVRIEDSGRGFDHQAVLNKAGGEQHDIADGMGIKIVLQQCASLVYNEQGTTVEAIVTAQRRGGGA